MKRPEEEQFSASKVHDLNSLIKAGEGETLEFKSKTNFPEKIIREMVAFANTKGGTLLIGVSDDGTMSGIKYPDEDAHTIRLSLQQFCRPALSFKEYLIPISNKKYVLMYHIPISKRKPHVLRLSKSIVESYVRVKDKSIKASRELLEILKRQQRSKDIKFTYGEIERMLIQYLTINPAISLYEFSKLSGLNKFKARRKLILLVLANVLKITPNESGDLYSLVGFN